MIRDLLMKPLFSECIRLGMKPQTMDVSKIKYKALPTQIPPNTTRNELIKETFERITSDHGKKMILVTLASGDRSEYAWVKYLGDVRHGIHTICIQTRHLAKRRGAVPTLSKNLLGNIAMKVNFKLGGINHILNTIPTFLKSKVMIVRIKYVQSFFDGRTN